MRPQHLMQNALKNSFIRNYKKKKPNKKAVNLLVGDFNARLSPKLGDMEDKIEPFLFQGDRPAREMDEGMATNRAMLMSYADKNNMYAMNTAFPKQ